MLCRHRMANDALCMTHFDSASWSHNAAGWQPILQFAGTNHLAGPLLFRDASIAALQRELQAASAEATEGRKLRAQLAAETSRRERLTIQVSSWQCMC